MVPEISNSLSDAPAAASTWTRLSAVGSENGLDRAQKRLEERPRRRSHPMTDEFQRRCGGYTVYKGHPYSNSKQPDMSLTNGRQFRTFLAQSSELLSNRDSEIPPNTRAGKPASVASESTILLGGPRAA